MTDHAERPGDDNERRRQAEDAAGAARLLQMAGHAARFGGWTVTLAGDGVVWSDEVAAIHEKPPGYSPSLEEGLSFYAPEWRARIDEVFGACAREGRPFDEEMEIITARGRRAWVRTIGEAMRDESGTITKVQGAFQDVTARRRAEADLKAAHEKLEALWGIASLANADVKTISDHILRVIARMTQSQYGFYGFVNPDESVMTIHSWSGEAMRDCSMVDKPQQFAVCQAGVWGEAIRSRVPLILNDYSAAHEGKRGLPDGHVALTNLLVVPSFSNGRITAVAAVANRARDYGLEDVDQLTAFLANAQAIVDRTRAEDAKIAIQARLDFALASSHIGGWDLDLRDQTAFRTIEHDRVFGYREPLPEWTYARFLAHVIPEDREEVDRQFQKAIREQGDWSCECRIRRHDGDQRWIWASGQHVIDESGRPVRMAGIVQDITDRKRAEEAWREALVYTRSLIEANLDSLVSIGADGTITDVNEATVLVTGVSREHLLGTDFAGYFTDPEKAREGYERVFSQGIVRDYPLTIRHACGRTADVLYHASVYRNAAGETQGVVAAAHDITELKRADTERERLEAANRQLQKADSLGRMAGAIAHHFNNQLQVVTGNLEMALSEPSPKGVARECMTEAMKATRRASEVSAVLLTYLGHAFLERAPLDLADVCRRILPMLQAAMPKDVTLEFDLPTPGPVVRANADQLQQVLTNLVTNAWESYRNGHGVIRLTVRTVAPTDIPAAHRFPVDWEPANDMYGCLEVADTGCGIPETDVDRLFDPFFSDKFVGRGMGLPAALGIVRAHEGVVTVESELGRGSVFRVHVPLTAATVHRSPQDVAATQDQPAPRTVLVVEDEAAVRTMVTAMLTRLGFAVLAAKDGFEAVELLRQHTDGIHCVLCDLTMPRMNGWETLGALRRIAPGIPVVLVSGYSEAQVMAGAQAERPQSFLNKPYRREQLSEAIRKAMARD